LSAAGEILGNDKVKSENKKIKRVFMVFSVFLKGDEVIIFKMYGITLGLCNIHAEKCTDLFPLYMDLTFLANRNF
jgi:hypothetical protein